MVRSNGQVTADGRRSSQFEHTLLITDTGTVPVHHPYIYRLLYGTLGVEVLTARLETSPPLDFEIPDELKF